MRTLNPSARRRLLVLAAAVPLALAGALGPAGTPPALAIAASHLAGYTDSAACSVTCVLQVSFTVPTIIGCPPGATQKVLLGGRFDTPSGQMQGGVALGCFAGIPGYGSFYQFSGGSPTSGMVPAPGQAMTVTLQITPAAGPMITINDITAGWTQSMFGATANPTSEHAGVQALGCNAVGQCWPVPQFSSPVTFSSMTFNGVLANTPPWTQSNLVPTTAPPDEVDSGALAAGTFSVLWLSTCAPGPKC